MRTTLDIHGQLLTEARRKAIEKKTTLTGIIEEALRRYLMPSSRPTRRVARDSVVVSGKSRPAVDVSDRERLYDAMESRR